MADYGLTVQRIGLAGITNILIALSAIILLPILTKTLSVSDYGTWSLLTVTIALVPLLVTLQLPYSIVRFLAASTDREHIRQAFFSIGFIILVASLITCGLFYLSAPQIARNLFNGNSVPALILPFIIFFACLNVFLLNFFRAFQQIKRYSVLAFVQTYILVALVAYFVLSGYGLQGAVVGLLIQQLFIFLVMICLIIAQIGVAMPKLSGTRAYIVFGLPLMPAALSSWITDSSDRYLIGLLLGTRAVGYYSPAYSLGGFIGLFAAPLVLLLPAVLSKHYDENNIEEVRIIMKYSLKYYFAIAVPSFFVLSILSLPLLRIFSTPEIAENGYLVTPFVALGMLLVGAYEVIVLVLALKKRTGRIGVIWILSAALNFGLNLILIPYLGIIGAALTTLLAFICAFGLTMRYSSRYFKFEINGVFILKSVCASLVVALLLFWWNPTGLTSIALAILLSAAVYLVALFVLRGFTIAEMKFFYRALTGRSSDLGLE